MFSLPRSPPLIPACCPVPATRFLSNGRYQVLITAAGSGSSTLDGLALTRWRGDAVEDADGFFIYLRDLDGGATWSAGLQPSGIVANRYRAHWRPGVFTIEQDVDDVGTVLDVCVPPDADVELRTLTLSNRAARRRRIELTTFIEVVLEEAAEFAAHPVFSKLFVETEHVARPGALLARRRARTPKRAYPCMVHALLGIPSIGFETDRAQFLGRCAQPGAPHALRSATKLSEGVGTVLDPILSLRAVVELEPGEQKQITCLLGAAPQRSASLAYVERYTNPGACRDALDAARGQAHREVERCELTQDEAEYFQSLAGALLYDSPALRSDAEPRECAPRARSAAAASARHRLSTHASHVVLHTKRPGGSALEPTLRKAQRYWQALGLPIELLVFGADVTPEVLDTFDATPRLVVDETLPDLAAGAVPNGDAMPVANHTRRTAPAGRSPAAPDTTRFDNTLEHFNGYGGFAAQGREYAIRLRCDRDGALRYPPRPWTNVIANEDFGFIASETGAGYTWSRNSREHRLTPWSNDPVLDPHGEAVYVRDEKSGAFWSPLAGPTPADADYEMRHGFGYSVCAHTSHDLQQRTRMFVPRHAPLKIMTIRLTNLSPRPRSLSVFAYYRLALGRKNGVRDVHTQLDPESGAILARNPSHDEFPDAVVFAAVVVQPQAVTPIHFTCDRTKFIGRNGSPAYPAALRRGGTLDDTNVAGPDACIAQQVRLELPPSGTLEVSFLFGEGNDTEHVRALIAEHGTPEAIEQAMDDVHQFWRRGLSGLQVETPLPALDLMINGWLPYQALSCRLWGRSALYQSGGAFGFRDQLQDASALVALWPDITRKQILLHAAQQFPEGDVLHWWHPPSGRGIRSRCVDDLVWLPWAVARYVRASGDWDVLAERTSFLAARHLGDGEDEALLLPKRTDATADVYEHCCLALDRALSARSKRGLPLFGSGDWNDGMNRVGREGRGESIWMGFFLYHVLGEFIPICERHDDSGRAQRYATQRDQLRDAIEAHAWDGAWYRRGYYDSGAALGSKGSDECVIDALAQAWAVLSNAAPCERATQAMQSVERDLVSETDGLIRLLWPPFENTAEDPGYIKGYARGVRENGGQYTHAALWVVGALAALGRNDRVAPLLEMLSPVSYTRTPERAARYGLEPYVVAADVYGAAPLVGRGGWSWYTGSAGWMYRIALESLLGFKLDAGNVVHLRPCIPNDWPEFKVRHRLPGEENGYEIVVRNPQRCAEAVLEARLDGEHLVVDDGGACIPLARDGRGHRVDVVLGPREGERST